MIILIDDVRDIQADVIVRSNYDVFLGILIYWPGAVSMLIMDNDLGEREIEGHQFLTEYLLHCADNMGFGHFPEEVKIVTDNPIAREKMHNTLAIDYGYSKNLDTGNYVKSEHGFYNSSYALALGIVS